MPSSPRVKYRRDKFQRGETLFVAACISASEAEGRLAMALGLLHDSAFPAWRKAGLEGIANYPTIGLTEGLFRSGLERINALRDLAR